MNQRNNKRPAPAALPSGFYSPTPTRTPHTGTEISGSAVYYAYASIQAPAARTTPRLVPTGAAPPPAETSNKKRREVFTAKQSQIQKISTDGPKGPRSTGFQTVTIQVPGCPVQHFRICVGNDPDDIRKWIQDRKRRFPRQKKLNDLLGDYGDSSSDESEPVDNPSSAFPATVRQSKTISKALIDTAPPIQNPNGPIASKQAHHQRSPTTTDHNRDGQHLRRSVCCRYFANGNCARGLHCSFSHQTPPTTTLVPPRSLMGKLLEQERRREAALTLQLLYMLHNEFEYFQNYSIQTEETPSVAIDAKSE